MVTDYNSAMFPVIRAFGHGWYAGFMYVGQSGTVRFPRTYDIWRRMVYEISVIMAI